MIGASNSSGIAGGGEARCNALMSTKSRQVIYGGRIMGADIRALDAREAAKQAIRDADRAEAEAWSIRMEAYGGQSAAFPSTPCDRPPRYADLET